MKAKDWIKEKGIKFSKSGGEQVLPLDYACKLMDEYASELCGKFVAPRSLTAGNGAKALLSGEFFETVEVDNSEYCGCGECDYCHDFPDSEPTIQIKVPVSWTTIKNIYEKIISHYNE